MDTPTDADTPTPAARPGRPSGGPAAPGLYQFRETVSGRVRLLSVTPGAGGRLQVWFGAAARWADEVPGQWDGPLGLAADAARPV